MWPAEQRWRAPRGDFPPPWASAWGDDVYGLWADLSVNGATQRLRWIEPSGPEGFLMGAPQKERDAIKDKDVRQWANEHEHEPQHTVIDEGFWLADTPCTQALWTAVTGQTPHHFNDGKDAALYPAVGISYQAAYDFLDKLKASTAIFGVGVVTGTGVDLGIGIGIAALPSEQQWEYACRADTKTAFWWGDAFDHAMANAKKNGTPIQDNNATTTPVKHYPPNPWGLYDMHGNVGEWCATDIQREEVMVRGGASIFHPARARAAFRLSNPISDGGTSQGFRFLLRSFHQ